MVELSLLSSATFSPGIFHQDPGLCRPHKEFQTQSPSHGKRQEVLKCGSIQLPSGPHFEDPWQSMNLFSDNNQPARAVSMNRNPVLIDVQDGHADSVLFSFGISEQCSRHEKILKFLASGSNLLEGGGFDISLLSDLMGFNPVAFDMCSQSHFPINSEFSLYEVGMDDSQHFMHPKKHFFAPKPLLDFVGSHTSNITVHPDGRVLFTGSGDEMKDLLSIVAEFYPSNKWTSGTKQAIVVPYFAWSGGRRARVSSRLSSPKLQTQTITPLKSPEKIKVKPQLKKKQNRRAGKERDLYTKNYFHACESLLSVVLDKGGRMSMLSLTKSGPEVNQLLIQFSAGIAGTGLAVLFSVVCKAAGGRVPFSAARLLNTGFGFGLFWLSWAVNGLRDTIAHLSKNSGKVKLRDDEIVLKVERSVNEVLFRALALMAVAALRFV